MMVLRLVVSRTDSRVAVAPWVVVACLLLSGSTRWADAAADVARQQSVITTVGEFRVVRDASNGHSVVLNGKVLVDNGPSPVFLSPLLKGRGQDFVLIFKTAGGRACQGMFHAVRVKSPIVVSEEFGTCSEAFRAKVEGDRLVVTMPAYVGQPELFDKAQLERLTRTEHVYTYVDGLLSEREVRK